MSDHKCQSCQEYSRLSRRNFLGLAGGALAAAAVPAWLPRVVLAQDHSSSRDVIVSIFLRGGVDGLTMCVPFGESAYYNLRPNLAIPAPDSSAAEKALDLDGFFGLPPAMQPLAEAFEDDQLLLVHACGISNNPTRSHFEAMKFMEVGMLNPSSDLFTGWLGRHLRVTAPTVRDAVLRAAAMGVGLPRTLVGAPKALALGEMPAEFGYNAGRPETLTRRTDALRGMYEFASASLKTASQTTFQTIDLLQQIDFESYVPAGEASYPEGEFGNALRSAAALIKAEVGVEAISVDIGGWDTHEQQGPLAGFMSQLMSGFASGLAAFHKDLASDNFDQVTLVAVSEFGRNAFENGSAGTDHGHGGLMLALGSGIRGGQVLTDWPGLEREQLFEAQDVKITTDYRDILTEILDKRAGNKDFRSVFPDPSYTPRDYGIAVPV